MAGGITTAFADIINDHIRVGGTTHTQDVALFVAMLDESSAASDTFASNSGKECDKGGYSRQSITFGASSGGIMANTNQITIGPFTDDPPSLTDFWIINSASGTGDIRFYGDLEDAIDADSGGSIIIEIGELKVTTT